MKNRWKNAVKELRGNRGSGVVLVLVVISCITLMTTSLLHLSYTAFKIKAADRMSKTDFYEADAKMDKLLTGIQEITSNAIVEAQKKVFITYSGSTDNGDFYAAVMNEMEDALQVTGSDKYNVSTLQDILQVPSNPSDPNSAKVPDTSVTIANDGDSICERTANSFTLKNVRLTYSSPKTGNRTTVQADITVDCTKLSYHYTTPNHALGSADHGEWNLQEIVTFENWSTY